MVILDAKADGIREMLTSSGVRAEVRRIAEATAGRARGRTDNEIVVVNAGRSRARSYIRMLGPEASVDESRDRILGRSLVNGG